MKNLELNAMGVQEMETKEKQKIEGGSPWVFVAGAIIGGMIYDAYKEACIALAEWQIENPDLVNVGSKR